MLLSRRCGGRGIVRGPAAGGDPHEGERREWRLLAEGGGGPSIGHRGLCRLQARLAGGIRGGHGATWAPA